MALNQRQLFFKQCSISKTNNHFLGARRRKTCASHEIIFRVTVQLLKIITAAHKRCDCSWTNSINETQMQKHQIGIPQEIPQKAQHVACL
jgi:hypothetical protein